MAQILVIEDSRTEQRMLQVILTLAGHQVVTADEGGEALDLYRRQPADVVITDLLMPGREGMETIRSLRDCDPGARIIAVSGAGPDLLAMAGGLGALRMLEKPFSATEILAAVREVLAG